MALMVSNTASPALMIMSYSLRPYSLDVLRSTSFISAKVRIGIIRSPVQVRKVAGLDAENKIIPLDANPAIADGCNRAKDEELWDKGEWDTVGQVLPLSFSLQSG